MNINCWDVIAEKYLSSITKDHNSDFAYERLVNGLSILSLCDNSGRALDLGCGDGRFTKELSSRFKEVVGIDFSNRLIRVAKSYCPGVKFIHHNLENGIPEFKNKFDLIICKLVLMYIKNIENIARDSYRELSTNGVMVVSVAHPMKWINEFRNKKGEELGYLGYLSEVGLPGKIANDNNLQVNFINRTLQTYVNTFTKYGFKLETILETGVPDQFVLKYPRYLPSQKKPYRLNMKFVKQ